MTVETNQLGGLLVLWTSQSPVRTGLLSLLTVQETGYIRVYVHLTPHIKEQRMNGMGDGAQGSLRMTWFPS